MHIYKVQLVQLKTVLLLFYYVISALCAEQEVGVPCPFIRNQRNGSSDSAHRISLLRK